MGWNGYGQRLILLFLCAQGRKCFPLQRQRLVQMLPHRMLSLLGLSVVVVVVVVVMLGSRCLNLCRSMMKLGWVGSRFVEYWSMAHNS